MLLLAAAYYGAAKLGQTLRYTASVSAIWPPAGLGIAALYLWGIRWWPGVLLGEFVVNGQLLLDDSSIPVGSLLGQQAGNMAEIIVGALLLRRLIGPNAAMDRVEQVGGMLVALATATAISATAGTISMLAGGVIDQSDAAEFWRTWWLGDTSGGLVVLPLMLAWAQHPLGAWRRIRTWEGAAMVVSVVALSVISFSTDEPVRYTVFPALIWAGFRFGPPGATLSIAITTCVAIGETAHDLGPFAEQEIDHRTLSTQLYIWVAALTTLFLSAVVSERERSSRELAEARRTEGARAMEERRRIARDLHDSVSQALFSTVLHTRTAQKALVQEGGSPSGRVGESLGAIADLARGVQGDIRSLIFELGRDPVHDGLVAALARDTLGVRPSDGLTVDVRGPGARLPLSERVETQLFAIGREALSNVRKHAGASAAHVRVVAQREPGDRRGPRQRAGLRSRRPTSRSLRPGLDAQPDRRDRGTDHDHERAGVWNARPSPRPGGDEWRLRWSRRADETIGVVIVDDHEVVRRGLLAFLDSEPDIDVLGEAAGGAQALDLLASMDSDGRRPDVVVMDLQMAPIDGIESTRQVRALYTDIEVVALTSFAEEERVHAALRAGASGYVLKDSDADDVAAAVRAVHRGELQIDPVVARRLMSSLREGRDQDPVSELTSRELDVLRLVAAGKPNKQIAAELDISERTARTHVSRILRKLRLSSRTQAALWAVREGLVEVEREPR